MHHDIWQKMDLLLCYLKNIVELRGQLDTKYGTYQFQPWYTGVPNFSSDFKRV